MDEHPKGFLYHNTDVFLTKDRKANRLDHNDVSLHLTTSDPQTSILLTVPDDGKTHTIPLNLAPGEEHSLHVQLGNHVPRHLISSNASPSSASAACTEQLCLTVRYTPPTTQQDKKATRRIQQYHARTIRQIETAFENAKQARLELEAALETSKTDLVAAAHEIHILTKELNRRRVIEVLYFDQTTTNKWFVVQAGVPSRLLDVPGSPLVCLQSGGDRVVDVTSLDEVVTAQRGVPVAALIPDPIEGKFVKEIALDGAPNNVARHEGKAYVIYAEGKMSMLDVESGAVVKEWAISGAGAFKGVAVHGEHVFVADYGSDCIRVLDMEGKQERQFGTEGSGNGQFFGPYGVAIAGELLYVCDYGNHRVQVLNLDGTWVRCWGSRGTGEGELQSPCCITVHGDEVYVADYWNHRVQVFGLDGRFRRMLGSKGTGDGEIYYPRGITVHGELAYVTDGNNRVQSFGVADGGFVGSWGTYGSAAGEFNRPHGLCVDDKDRLWVCDQDNSRLQLFR